MGLLKHHAKAQEFVVRGDVAAREGRSDEARKLYLIAVVIERDVLRKVRPHLARTWEIFAVSLVALLCKVGSFEEAIVYAQEGLKKETLSDWARDQFQTLLERAHRRSGLPKGAVEEDL